MPSNLRSHNEEKIRHWLIWDLPAIHLGYGLDPDQPINRKSKLEGRDLLHSRACRRVDNPDLARSSDYLYYLIEANESTSRYEAFLAANHPLYHSALLQFALYAPHPPGEIERIKKFDPLGAFVGGICERGLEKALDKTVADDYELAVLPPPEGEPSARELASFDDRRDGVRNAFTRALKNGETEKEAAARVADQTGYSRQRVREITDDLRQGYSRARGKRQA